MQKAHSRVLLYWVPVVTYCGFIFFLSSKPSPESIPQFFGVDKLLHIGAYGLLGILFYRAYGVTSAGKNVTLLIIFSILSAGLYGISDEIHQSFNPSRNPSIPDVIADFLGASLGVWFYHYIAIRFPVLSANHRLTR